MRTATNGSVVGRVVNVRHGPRTVLAVGRGLTPVRCLGFRCPVLRLRHTMAGLDTTEPCAAQYERSHFTGRFVAAGCRPQVTWKTTKRRHERVRHSASSTQAGPAKTILGPNGAMRITPSVSISAGSSCAAAEQVRLRGGDTGAQVVSGAVPDAIGGHPGSGLGSVFTTPHDSRISTHNPSLRHIWPSGSYKQVQVRARGVPSGIGESRGGELFEGFGRDRVAAGAVGSDALATSATNSPATGSARRTSVCPVCSPAGRSWRVTCGPGWPPCRTYASARTPTCSG